MLSPVVLETIAHELVRRRLAEAAHDALADQLPHTSTPRPFTTARRHLADRLRALAGHLDPSVAGEAGLIIASPR
jgi:hypothetical protein